MSRPNEFKTPTKKFEDVSGALKVLDTLIEDVEKRKGQVNGKSASCQYYRSHVAGLKESIDTILNAAVEEWKQEGLDRSFCQRSDKMTVHEFCFNMGFIHPIYEQIWLSDPDNHNVSLELIPFMEISLKYCKAKSTVFLSRTVLDVSLHLPELSASCSSTQAELELIKKETLRVEAVNKQALATTKQLTEELNQYCEKRRLKFEGSDIKSVEKSEKTVDTPAPDAAVDANAPQTPVSANPDNVAEPADDSEEITQADLKLPETIEMAEDSAPKPPENKNKSEDKKKAPLKSSIKTAIGSVKLGKKRMKKTTAPDSRVAKPVNAAPAR